MNIVREDKKVVWTLMPDEEMYMETPMTDQRKNPLTFDDVGKGTVTRHSVLPVDGVSISD